MLEKLRAKMIRLEDRGNYIQIRSMGGGKRVISKKHLRVLDDSVFNNNCNAVNSVINDYFVNHHVYKTKVSVQGFFSTGSTAIIDLLREFSNTTSVAAIEIETCGKEFLDDIGIEIKFYTWMELDRLYRIVEVQDAIEIDRMLKKLIDDAKRSFNFGMFMYHHSVRANLINIFNEFFYKLVDINFCKVNSYDEFPPVRSVGDNISKNNFYDYIFYKLKSGISKDYINICVKEFIEKVLCSIESRDFLILDQFLADNYNGYDLDYHKQFLGDIKQIAVYRDPRDQFMTNFIWSEHVWHGTVQRCVEQEHIKMYKQLLDNYRQSHQDRLFISFESLVNDYENSIDKICNFLGIDKSHHVNKFKHFNPEVSRKNIGIYKNFHDQKLMQQIYENFKEYCYEG